MSLAVAFKVAARRRTVVTLALSLAVAGMVSTILASGAGLVESSSKLASRIVGVREKLEPVTACSGDCVRSCMVELRVNNVSRRVPLFVDPSSGGYEGVKLGYLLAQTLNIKQDDTVGIRYGDYTVAVEVAGVFRGDSIADAGMVASHGFPWCREVYYERVEEGFSDYTESFSQQVEELVDSWWLAAVGVMAVGSVVASLKAYIDLEGDIESFVEEGSDPRSLAYALTLLFAASVFTGYAWGKVAADLVNDLVATYTGVYIPPSPTSLESLAVQGLIPSLIAGVAALLTGLAGAARPRENSP